METLPPSEKDYNYLSSGIDKGSPAIPAFVKETLEARRQVTELDRQLRYINAIDNTRQAFKSFY